MIEGVKEIEIDGMQFQLFPMKGMKSFLLEKKIMTMLVPIIGGLKDMDAEVDFKVVSEGIYEALTSLNEIEYKKLVLDLISEIMLIPTNPQAGEGQALQMNESVINNKFSGKTMVLYKLIIESLKFNKFLPFEMVAGGLKMRQIVSSFEQKKKVKKSGSK